MIANQIVQFYLVISHFGSNFLGGLGDMVVMQGKLERKVCGGFFEGGSSNITLRTSSAAPEHTNISHC
jgi:hypothetical protein